MRIAGYVMAAVFAVFAVLQYNDPDALLWAVTYGLIAAISVAAALGRVPLALPLLASLVALPWALVLAPTIDAGWYHNEAAREAFGLMIAALWMVVVAGSVWRRTAQGRPRLPL